MRHLSLLTLLCFTSLAPRPAHSVYTEITSVEDLKAFAEEVNSGSEYKKSTVTLTTDLDLTDVDFTTIGTYADNSGNGVSFRGLFEGGGHVISNLNFSSSEKRYAGFFGYLNGGAVKNLVIDSSCVITNNCEASKSHTGGIAGYVYSGVYNSELLIMNCVNMASITVSGSSSNTGGIAGYMCADSSPATVVNCVNLGNITYSGDASGESKPSLVIGGIVGWFTSENSVNVSSIRNCVNLGHIKSTAPNAAGIVGENSFSYNIIKNNFLLSGTSALAVSGSVPYSNSIDFNTSYILSTGGPLVDALNDYVDSQTVYDLRKWGAVTFDTNGGSTVGARMTMFVMLGTPDAPTRTGGTFDGWCTDPAFKTEFSMATRYDSGVGASLYAKWVMNQYSVVFDFGNGTRTEEIILEYDEAITYPANPEAMEGYTFNGWDKNITNMPPENITITAVWNANNYTVTFDFGNGTTIEKIISFNETIIYPADPMMEGYIFNGWDKNITNMPAQNVTITAMWKEIPTEYVEIVFNKKGMTKDEVREFISKYVQNDNYVIKTFEPGNDGTTVIIKFNDANEAQNFVDVIETSSDIKSVKFLSRDPFSYSENLLPSFLFVLTSVVITFSQF